MRTIINCMMQYFTICLWFLSVSFFLPFLCFFTYTAILFKPFIKMQSTQWFFSLLKIYFLYSQKMPTRKRNEKKNWLLPMISNEKNHTKQMKWLKAIEMRLNWSQCFGNCATRCSSFVFYSVFYWIIAHGLACRNATVCMCVCVQV